MDGANSEATPEQRKATGDSKHRRSRSPGRERSRSRRRRRRRSRSRSRERERVKARERSEPAPAPAPALRPRSQEPLTVLHTLPPRVPISGLRRPPNIIIAIITITDATTTVGAGDVLLRLAGKGTDVTIIRIVLAAKSLKLTEPRIVQAVVENRLPRRTNAAILAQRPPTALTAIDTTAIDTAVPVRAHLHPARAITNIQVAEIGGSLPENLLSEGKAWPQAALSKAQWIRISLADVLLIVVEAEGLLPVKGSHGEATWIIVEARSATTTADTLALRHAAEAERKATGGHLARADTAVALAQEDLLHLEAASVGAGAKVDHHEVALLELTAAGARGGTLGL
ncbi:hypothetical protein AC579_10463 [Pseudocercospora musae]|uniref:Uncharacterized protein n=1 Tax=Pseudocercospora musae TaxID=113226 RepID=A0A139IDW8_9PEZI|nr:hypothetical protein AC579_10463 [Pseudocercospora musae]